MIYFPTRVVLIDDDGTFLDSLKTLFYKLPLRVETFHRPTDAVDFVQNNIDEMTAEGIYPPPFTDDDAYEAWATRLIHNPRKYDLVSCIVSDYLMHPTTGIEELNKMDKRLSKILMSGVLPTEDAIKALNSDSVTKFIEKTGERRFIDNFNKYVPREACRFLAHTLCDPIHKAASLEAQNICLEEGFIELYPLDFSGVYLLRTGTGSEKLLYFPGPEECTIQHDYGQERGGICGDSGEVKCGDAFCMQLWG